MMKKAFGLAEVVVAIAIFGVVMVITISMTVAALRTVKDNELSDLANSIMITSLEYAKSPAGFNAISGGTVATGSLRSFKVNTSLYDPNNPNFTDFQLQEVNQTNRISTCNSNSRFLVKIASSNSPGTSELNNFRVCNQLLIQEASDQTVTITSVVVYTVSGRTTISELVGFKNRL